MFPTFFSFLGACVQVRRRWPCMSVGPLVLYFWGGWLGESSFGGEGRGENGSGELEKVEKMR
jgi:hypothetical protein